MEKNDILAHCGKCAVWHLVTVWKVCSFSPPAFSMFDLALYYRQPQKSDYRFTSAGHIQIPGYIIYCVISQTIPHSHAHVQLPPTLVIKFGGFPPPKKNQNCNCNSMTYLPFPSQGTGCRESISEIFSTFPQWASKANGDITISLFAPNR